MIAGFCAGRNILFDVDVNICWTKDYLRRKTGVSSLDKAMRENLSPIEVKLLESQDLMEVRGKFGRGVPVIIPEDLRKVLNYLTNAEVRLAAGMMASNHYLFPNNGNGVIRAYDSLKKLCGEAELSKPERITSVYLRKYMATLSQIFDLNAHQLQWVSNHLGHFVDIHKIHYRQTSGVIERVDMPKLMLLQEYNLTANFAGKSLADIQLPDLVFGKDSDHDDKLCTDEDLAAGEGVASLLETSCADEDYQPEVSTAASTRVKWTGEEVQEVKEYFKEHIESRTTPGIQDYLKAIEQSKKRKGVLHKRSWGNSEKESVEYDKETVN